MLMVKVPSIKGSAQARLLLYRLLSSKFSETEESMLKQARGGVGAQQPELFSTAQLRAHDCELQKIFAFIESFTRNGLQKQIEKLTGQSLWLGVFPQGLLESFIAEHKMLIKSVSEEHRDKIALTINRGIRDGRLQKDIAKEIQMATSLSKWRAQLIARNGPIQYSGALTKHHQTSAGIKSYIWQSSRDERVRDMHRKLDGEIFDWDGPGPHPRSEVNCRCDAVPILGDI